MKTKTPILTAMLALALTGGPEALFAHHSSALYDMQSPVTVTGVVTRFDWSNPHAYIYLDVKGPNDRVEEWTIQMTSLGLLKSYGWTKDLIKVGDVISCTGGRAKTGEPAMLSSVVKLPDGRRIQS